MDGAEPSLIFPEDVESAILRVGDMPEDTRTDYQNYLDSRVFEMLRLVRPWGINGETMRYLLMDTLAAEEMAKGLPCPALEDVEGILSEQWVIENVRKRHQVYELGVLKVQEAERKFSPRLCTVPINGMINEIRTFIDFGADLDVLQEVAVMKKEMDGKGEQLASRITESYSRYMKQKLPGCKNAEPVFTVSDTRVELKKITIKKFNEEEPVPKKRWTWFGSEDLDSLKKMPESVKVLQEKLFTDELKDEESDRSRKMSMSESVSSMNSRKDTAESRASQQTEDEGGAKGTKRKALGRPQGSAKRVSAVPPPPVKTGTRGRSSKPSTNL
ncbi:hypothetical protein RvY_16451 [Ramazzottius varieornatus]|uniref:Uncharacterized protein n=1 Tax=Ramazzottius varieornatus TaxID=947166 RepID=A0A1D1VYH8_RAMVA|nr:hypothetical protein RvY_16451 [Ramazzottius varieornatus]